MSQPDLRQDAQIAPAPPKSAPSQLCHRTLSAESSHTETRHVKVCQQLAVSDFGHFFVCKKLTPQFHTVSQFGHLDPGSAQAPVSKDLCSNLEEAVDPSSLHKPVDLNWSRPTVDQNRRFLTSVADSNGGFGVAFGRVT